jgi:hypothetical protein
MHPKEYFFSGLGAMRGTMQVGTIRVGPAPNDRHAALWLGTPESVVDLHPAGAEWSTARATDGVLQGGYVDWEATNTITPVIWNGSAQSMINLRPGGYGYLYGMAPGVQVGQVDEPGAIKAALWRGSAASFVDLSPPGIGGSRLRATTGRVHVGAFGQSGLARAGVNFNSPESWVSLHQFLPPQYGSFSEAMCVYQAGDTIYVGGWATRNFGGNEAILWIGTLPCYANCDESTTPPYLNVADFSCFLQRFADGDGYANCDKSTTAPILNVADFSCFLAKFAQGCF